MTENMQRKTSGRDLADVEENTGASGYIDWKNLAQERLVRLVEIEHDHSVVLERLSALQTDYRQLLVRESELHFHKRDNEELRRQNKEIFSEKEELWTLKNDLVARYEEVRGAYEGLRRRNKELLSENEQLWGQKNGFVARQEKLRNANAEAGLMSVNRFSGRVSRPFRFLMRLVRKSG